MAKLRHRMIEDMQLRNLAAATQRNYILHVARFARFFNLSPEHLGLEDIRQFHLHLLQDGHLSPEAVNQSVSALKYLYIKVLVMSWGNDHFPRAKRLHKLPVILSPEEVSAFFEHVLSLRHRAAVITCNGAGRDFFAFSHLAKDGTGLARSSLTRSRPAKKGIPPRRRDPRLVRTALLDFPRDANIKFPGEPAVSQPPLIE